MSLSSIAANVYTIQSRKKVPLKTAFSMMVREDLAMRFSVYNLVKTVTRSDLLATILQASYGKRTPLQKKQDEQEEKQKKNEKQFKQFTAGSIATLNKRLNLLEEVTRQNSAMITAIYKDIGYFKGQRKTEAFSSRAIRLPVMSKSIKGKIDEINDKLKKLEKIGKKPYVAKNKQQKKEKTTKESQEGFLDKLLPFLLKNPRMLAMMAGGTAGALSLGSFAAQAASLFNLSDSAQRIIGRLQGKPGFQDDPLIGSYQEDLSRMVDTGIATVGAGTLAGLSTAAALKIRKNRIAKATPADAAAARMRSMNTQTDRLTKLGMNRKRAQKVAGKSNKVFNFLAKQKMINSAFKAVAKKLPAIAAAEVAYELSKMSEYIVDRESNKITEQEFKKNMVSSYAELISNVGIGGMTTVIGGLAGTALFPGLGTVGGLVLGGVAGGILSLFLDDDMLGVAETVYNIIYENKSVQTKETTSASNIPTGTGSKPASLQPRPSGGTPSVNVPPNITSSESAKSSQRIELKDSSGKVIEVREGGNINWRNNNPGNIRYGDYAKSKGAIGQNGGFAIFPTMEAGRKAADDLLSKGTNYKDLNIAQAIARWAPSEDNNNPALYAATIAKMTGVDTSKKYVDLSSADKGKVLDAMTRIEGGAVGKVYRGSEIQKVASQPAADTPSMRVAAQPVVNPPPPVPTPAAIVNPAPPAAQTNQPDTRSSSQAQTDVRALASLGAIEALNKNMNSRLSLIEQRIVGIEGLNKQPFPFVYDQNFT